jgi:hypothetical protein
MSTSIAFGSNENIVSGTWTEIKTIILAKVLPLQYAQDPGKYTIYGLDDGIAYVCTIWTGTVPNGVITGGYSQAQNDTDKSDFETNYKPYANMPLAKGNFDDPRIIYKLGNITTTSTSETLVSLRPYVEQASEGQRSVKSSSNQDSPSGSGAAAVRITYLTSNYVLKTEDITLSGTSRISTVNTDIRFIENFEVIQGAAAVGAISLLDSPSGAQNEFCGISAATTQAFLCHHYVPAGKRAWILDWSTAADNQVKMKLYGQARFGTNLVDRILDLYDLRTQATAPVTLSFYKDVKGVMLPEKSYFKITVVAQQNTSTTTRAVMNIWEDVT